MGRIADPERYPCGHPRTEANSQSVGIGNGVRCRTCRRAMVNRLRREANPDQVDNAIWRTRRERYGPTGRRP